VLSLAYIFLEANVADNLSFLDHISTSSTDNATADDVRACVDAAGDMGTSITGAAGINVGGDGNASGNDSGGVSSESSGG
jgi:hypothetical protein